jgi:hypothetical protein
MNLFRAHIYQGLACNFDTSIYQRPVGNANAKLFHDWLSRGFGTSPTWTPQVTCHGNSMTEGSTVTAAQSWVSLLRDAYGAANVAVWNFGSDGQTTQEMINRFPAHIAPMVNQYRSGDTYVAWEGTNMIATGVTAAQNAAKLIEDCSLARAAGFRKIVLVNVINRGGGFTNTDRQKIVDTNTILAAGNSAFDRLVDAYSIFPDYTDLTKYNGDQVHINANGHSLLMPAIKTAIDT